MANTVLSNAREAFQKFPLGLYIVATPIGNLADMTDRARQVLAEVDIIACEDTRVTGNLLRHFGVKNKMISYHDHNGAGRRPQILALLAEGNRIALTSDAGTPLISDPGCKLVADVRAAGYRVIPIPGASALIAALSVCGLSTQRIGFHGFPPPKSSQRKVFFQDLKDRPETLVFYESTRRLKASLQDMMLVFGNRKAIVARELTKAFEEVVGDDLSSLLENFEKREEIKGECVVLIEGCMTEPADITHITLGLDDFLQKSSKEVGQKAASSLAALFFGGSKRDYYQALLKPSKN